MLCLRKEIGLPESTKRNERRGNLPTEQSSKERGEHERDVCCNTHGRVRSSRPLPSPSDPIPFL